MWRHRLAGLAVFIAMAVCVAMPAHADLDSALTSVKAQARVVDAQADKSGNMYVLVKPEKLNWNLFAGAVCSLIRPHKARIFRVRVIEITQANNSKPPATWSRLGEAACSG